MTKTIFIEGMSCNHCVHHVEEALKEICGIKFVKVDLTEKKAIVELDHKVDDDDIKNAIDEAGYRVTNIQ